MIRRAARIARLSQTSQIPNSADGTPAIVVTLNRPGCAAGLMHRCIDNQVSLHIPFKIVNGGARASNPFFEARIISDVVRENVPVTRWRFGVWTIRPELRQHSHIVATLDHVGRVWLACGRVDWMPSAIILPKRIISECTGGNIDHGTIVRS